MRKKTVKQLFVGMAATMSVLGALTTSAFAETPTIPSSSASQTVNLSTSIDPTTTLAVSTNSIDFGNINPLITSYERDLTATVQSNASYNVTAVASDDFKTADATPKSFSINHLGIKLQTDANYQKMSKDASNPVTLASSQPATANTVYPINLQLNTDWLNAVPGSYSTKLTLQAAQF
ncbi:MAG: hypothetical protein PHX70_07875 [Clostridium sp.]|nr:hypothetical protein [Clostridium sp.]